MNIPYEKWYNAIKMRHSRRQYVKKELDDNTINKLADFIEELNNSMEGVRTVLVKKCGDDVFTGIAGSYGKIKYAPSYVAFIGRADEPNVYEKIGYMGECFILEATSMGLGTCWVAGTLNKQTVLDHINLSNGENVYCITPVGYTENDKSTGEKIMGMFTRSHTRKALEELCINKNIDEFPEWVKISLEAARLAPSAVNRQPWRFYVESDSITIRETSKAMAGTLSKRLDCGIAMLHIEIGARFKGISGTWEYLNSPDVAVFKGEAASF